MGSRRNSSDPEADSAAAGISTRLADLKSLLARFRDRSALDRFRDKPANLPSLLDRLASAARVDAAYLVVAAGTVLYVYLNRVAKDLTMFQFDSPEADVLASRVLAVAAFALLQQAAGLDPGSWLRLHGESREPASAGGPLGPVLALPTPVAGVACASLFVLLALTLSLSLTLAPAQALIWPGAPCSSHCRWPRSAPRASGCYPCTARASPARRARCSRCSWRR